MCPDGNQNLWSFADWQDRAVWSRVFGLILPFRPGRLAFLFVRSDKNKKPFFWISMVLF